MSVINSFRNTTERVLSNLTLYLLLSVQCHVQLDTTCFICTLLCYRPTSVLLPSTTWRYSTTWLRPNTIASNRWETVSLSGQSILGSHFVHIQAMCACMQHGNYFMISVVFDYPTDFLNRKLTAVQSRKALTLDWFTKTHALLLCTAVIYVPILNTLCPPAIDIKKKPSTSRGSLLKRSPVLPEVLILSLLKRSPALSRGSNPLFVMTQGKVSF